MPLLPDILSLDLEDLQVRAREYEKTIDQLTEENGKLQTNEKNMGANLNLSRQQIAAFQKKSSDTALLAQLSLSNAQNTADLATIAKLQADVKKKDETIKQLRSTKSAKDKSIDENKPDDSDSDNSDNVSEPDQKALWGRIHELENALNEARKQAKDATKKADHSTAAEQALIEKGDELTATIAELETELENAEERIANGVEELRDADRELHECRERLACADARLEDAIRELKNVDGMAKELVACQKDFSRENNALERERKAKRKLEADLRNEEMAHHQAQHTLLSKQKDVEDSVKEVQELEAKLEGAYQDLKDANGEIEKYKSRSEHFEEAANAHRKTKKDMEKMHKVAMGELGKMRNRPQVMRESREEDRSGRVEIGLDWE